MLEGMRRYVKCVYVQEVHQRVRERGTMYNRLEERKEGVEVIRRKK